MTFDLRLVHAARVVIETAGDLEVRDDRTRHPLVRGIEELGQLLQALVQQFTTHTEVGQTRAHL